MSPDYRQRLAYGTDQGRWLMDEIPAHRRVRRPPTKTHHHIVYPQMPHGDGAAHKTETFMCVTAVTFFCSMLAIATFVVYAHIGSF